MISFVGSRVLITGGLGFIGSNLAKRLVGLGAEVTLADSLIPQYGGNLRNIADFEESLSVNVTDVRDPYAMEYLVSRCDFLFNMAGQTSHIDSMDKPQEDLAINAAAQLSILEACRKKNPKIKIVFASTRQIYGRPSYLPVDESHPVHPVDVNGVNKLAGEWYHRLYAEVHGIDTSILRLTNTYGPGMRVKDARQTFVGIWIRRILEGKALAIFGDGNQRRDFSYVDDAVEAFLLAAGDASRAGNVYNLSGDEVVSLKELADILVVTSGGAASYELVPFPPERKAIDIGDYYGSSERFRAATGWKPRVNLLEGLKKTLDYYRIELPNYIDPQGQD